MKEQPPPRQIHSPLLTGVSIVSDKNKLIAKLEVTSLGQSVAISITNPRPLTDRNKLSESDIESQFTEECSMLSVFSNRVEFWSHDGYLSRIGGGAVEIE